MLNQQSKKNNRVNISASTTSSGITLGMLNDVYPSNMSATIYDCDDNGDAVGVVFDGYLSLAIATYPELADYVITYLSPRGSTKLSIMIHNVDFEYTTAW